MDLKQCWRISIHRLKTNKVTVAACALVTFFLWHGMTATVTQDADSSVPTSIYNDEDSNRVGINHKKRNENLSDFDVLDIRGINSKLQSLKQVNVNANPILSIPEKYSATKNDRDVRKGERAQALVGQAFNVLDNFIDANTSETYKGMKSMFSMWNPKSSKVIIISITPY